MVTGEFSLGEFPKAGRGCDGIPNHEIFELTLGVGGVGDSQPMSHTLIYIYIYIYIFLGEPDF